MEHQLWSITRARQNIIVRIYIFSQKLRRYFFEILSQKNIFWRKDIFKYLLGNYLFKSENIFSEYIIVSWGENIFSKISSRKMKWYFSARYIAKKISFHFCEKIFQKYIIISIKSKDIFWYRDNLKSQNLKISISFDRNRLQKSLRNSNLR